MLSRSYYRREVCLVIAETAVVFSFLAIVVHVLRSLSRRLVFRLNAEIPHAANYLITEEDEELLVQVITKQRLALVAEKLSSPRLLIATVGITSLSALIALLGAMLAIRKFRQRESTKEPI